MKEKLSETSDSGNDSEKSELEESPKSAIFEARWKKALRGFFKTFVWGRY